MMKFFTLTIFVAIAHGAVVDRPCNTICPEYAMYPPICGDDGEVYWNSCFFESAQCFAGLRGETIKQVDSTECGFDPIEPVYDEPESEGMADWPDIPSDGCERACPLYEMTPPLCGSDGKTYGNGCFFEAAQCRAALEGITLVEMESEFCFTTYVNPVARGIGDYQRACPFISQVPMICGSDGRFYANTCHFESAQCLAGLKDEILTERATNECQGSVVPAAQCNRICPDITREPPICGHDGRVYKNECFIEVAACYALLDGIHLYIESDLSICGL